MSVLIFSNAIDFVFCRYVTALRSFFSPTFGQRSDIGEGLECWRGYYQSVRPTQMGLSLNIGIVLELVTMLSYVVILNLVSFICGLIR